MNLKGMKEEIRIALIGSAARDATCGHSCFCGVCDAGCIRAEDVADLVAIVEAADALAEAADGAGDCALLRAAATDRLRDALAAYRVAREA